MVRRQASRLPASLLAGLLLAAAVARAGEPSPRHVDYARDVRPILERHCYRCHGPEKQRSRFRLDRRADVLRGGESGEPGLVPGKSAESHLIQLVSGTDPDRVMPPGDKRLSPDQIAVLRAWVDQGAPWPADADVAEHKPTTDHWSFQPLTHPVPPAGNGDAANPVDAFVRERLRRAGLKPSPPADRVALIRRLFLDLHGLPPTPERVAAFVADARPDAYARLVDEALASPRYGERWGQHWLDVVRYADTHGFEMNQERPNAWPYRDYVLRAFNEDKPYDRFVREQLAGDALGEDAATGFLVCGPWDQVKSPDPALTAQQRQDELNEILLATGGAFLGLTVQCARCHNHKFDPITQKDYYALQAVFAGVQYGDRPAHTLANGPDPTPDLQQQLDQVRQRLARLLDEPAAARPPVDPRWNVERFAPVEVRFIRFTVSATNNGIEPCLDELEIWSPAADRGRRNVGRGAGVKVTSSGDYAGNPKHQLAHLLDGRHGNDFSWISNQAGAGWVQVELPEATLIDRVSWGRDRTGGFRDRLPTRYRVEVATQPGQWQTVATSDDRPLYRDAAAVTLPPVVEEEVKAEARLREAAAGPRVYAGTFQQPGPTHRLYRGDPLAAREPVGPDTLSILGSLRLAADVPEQQRRVALARWITDPANPLTARVLANRVWQHHFGVGLADTPNDFGANGSRPTHPELLDWLAGELLRSGWSVKHLHRLILLSATYQQSNRPDAHALTVDAGNRLLWRFAPRRLEAEAVRDSILAASGVLDRRMDGPGFSVFEPNTNYVRVYVPKETFGPAEWRRMVYAVKVRREGDAVFGVFDCPDAGQVAPKRSRSTTALQALNLLNSSFMVQQAELLAARLRQEAGESVDQQVRRAFQIAFGRDPTSSEETAARRLVADHGLAALGRALLNANEFLFLP